MYKIKIINKKDEKDTVIMKLKNYNEVIEFFVKYKLTINKNTIIVEKITKGS